jgi:hypothetical protein
MTEPAPPVLLAKRCFSRAPADAALSGIFSPYPQTLKVTKAGRRPAVFIALTQVEIGFGDLVPFDTEFEPLAECPEHFVPAAAGHLPRAAAHKILIAGLILWKA